jgi:hypothetical protein
MGHTTSISDYELERGDGPPPCDGVDIEAPAEKSARQSKVVEPEPKPAAKKTTAKTKAAPQPEEEEEEPLEGWTVNELKDALDEAGIDYPASARKAELIGLLEE